MSINAKLAKVQSELHAPKSQVNKFGGYNYRSCEDILQAVKPLLGESTIVVNDEIVAVADRIYVKATATFSDGSETVTATAYAREADQKKGMDPAQLTGATSSYARKYALNGLLLIDDNRDADSMDNRDQGQGQGQQQQQKQPQQQQQQQKRQQPAPPDPKAVIAAISSAGTQQDVNKYVQTAQQRGVNADGMKKIQQAAMDRISNLEG